ncbi:MAG: DUF4942 domain-containing protein [Methylophilus sp.]|uniref:DUF4942 domain-containing protein n=1 Tax=Methylophilus sp. TaxID=29541 RepID=UPI003FA061BB
MQFDVHQFYPTPPELRDRAWKLFQNREFTTVLEPSAGEGHLIPGEIVESDEEFRERCEAFGDVNVMTKRKRYKITREIKGVHCIELDISKHDILRAKGHKVVGVDFMKFSSGSMFSHIILNPPFNAGVTHALHAWDIAYSAEIVIILNAESVRNPRSNDARRLCDLIEEHGSVEYIENAFIEAERETAVEIALIYLNKVSSYADDVVGDIWSQLQSEEVEDITGEAFQQHALAVPKNYIENLVVAFKASDIALRQSLFAKYRFTHYASMLGQTIENLRSDTNNKIQGMRPKELQVEYAEGYQDLKNRAWTSILCSTEVRDKMSKKSLAKFESDFIHIKSLEFNTANIYGFICGLLDKQGEIQEEMMLEFFDSVTRYRSDCKNAVHYCGYKSNDKHLIGMKIRTTRFILPNNRWFGSVSWEAKQKLADFDKVFAMLDGKPGCEFGLYDAFNDKETEKRLESGERIKTDYFEIRSYKVGTIHFFPTRKDIIDRLNFRVGQIRRWLPTSVDATDSEYWKHYEAAEKSEKAVEEAIKSCSRGSYDNPWWYLNQGEEREPGRFQGIADAVYNAIESDMAKRGIDINKRIESKPTKGQQQEVLQLTLAA